MAKVLVYDIETAPNLGYTWGKWQQDVIEFVDDWYILSFAWKWLGDKHVKCVSQESWTEVEVVTHLRDLLDECDVAVTHNGITFDKHKAQSRMLVYGIDPPSPYKEVDTLQVARKQFAFTSNRLGDLARALGLEHKKDPGGFKTWLGCMENDPKAWATMKAYNKQDVKVTEQLYLRMLPWIQNHPNIALLENRPDVCPRCGSQDGMVVRGYKHYSVTKRANYQCKACGGYSLGRAIVKSDVRHTPA